MAIKYGNKTKQVKTFIAARRWMSGTETQGIETRVIKSLVGKLQERERERERVREWEGRLITKIFLVSLNNFTIYV